MSKLKDKADRSEPAVPPGVLGKAGEEGWPPEPAGRLPTPPQDVTATPAARLALRAGQPRSGAERADSAGSLRMDKLLKRVFRGQI